MENFLYLFLLSLLCEVCCASFFPMELVERGSEESLIVQKNDRPLYAGGGASSNMARFSDGDVWVREGSVFVGTGCSCLYKDLQTAQVDGLKLLTPFIMDFVGSGLNFKSFVSQRCPYVPYKDILCYFVSTIRWRMLMQYSTEDIQPEFGSWAQFGSHAETRWEKRIVWRPGVGDEYGPGSVWISCCGRKSLCYRPEYGPECMQYIYVLSPRNFDAWPENWRGILREIHQFLQSGEHDFEAYCPQGFLQVAGVVKAVLGGRAASWDEPVWFAWKPQCSEDDPVLQVNEGDMLLKGTKMQEGFYCQGCEWIVQRGGIYAVRYCSGGAVFQCRDRHVLCARAAGKVDLFQLPVQSCFVDAPENFCDCWEILVKGS